MYSPNEIHQPGPGIEFVSSIREPYAVTLVASFPVNELKNYLEDGFAALGARYAVCASPFTSVIRYMLHQEGGLPRRPEGIHILLFRFEDWNNVSGLSGGFDGVHPASRALIERNLRDMVQALQNAAEICFGAVILVPCPASAKYAGSKAASDYYCSIEQQFRAAIAPYPQFFVPFAQTEFEGSSLHDEGAEGYTDAFWRQLARQLIRICYAAESRPWRSVVLGAQGATKSQFLRSFIARQWQAGRSLGLAADPAYDIEPLDGYAATDQRSVAMPEKVGAIAQGLMTPLHDLIVVGSLDECEQVRARHPQVLALPMCLPNDLEYLADELWCFDPIVERWITERDAMKPTIPRMTNHALLQLATHPGCTVPECVTSQSIGSRSH